MANRTTSGIAPGPSALSRPLMADLSKWTLACNIQQELQSLKSSLATVQKLIEASNSNPSAASKTFDDVGETIKVLERVHASIVDDISITARPTARSAATARKLFDVAELLEKILLNLDFADSLRAQQVNKTFRRAFKHSTSLQQRLGLRAVTEGPTFSPLIDPLFVSRGCLVRFQPFLRRGGPWVGEDEVAISATFSNVNPFVSRELPIPGPTLRKALLCQPPLTRMTVRTSCCQDAFLGQRSNARMTIWAQPAATAGEDGKAPTVPDLEVETGVTLGDIYDETKRLQNAHCLCPEADVGQHREDGTVDVQVYFEAVRQLQPGDPILVCRRKAKNDFETINQNASEDNALWEENIVKYMAAKRAARDSGLPIPTLRQYHDAARAEAEERTHDTMRGGYNQIFYDTARVTHNVRS